MVFCFMLLGWVVYREVYEPLPAFAVPVDSNGLAVGGGVKMANMRYEPTRAQVSADIAKWIVLIRSRPSDGFALRQNLMTAEVYMSTAGIELWNGYKAKVDPFENYRTSSDQSSRVTIIVSGPTDNLIKDIATFPVVTQNEGNSYTANWRETRWEMGSSVTYDMTATVHAKSTPQKDERKMSINPGGTEVSWFDWRGKPLGQK
jgi:type IV secretory pathway TrbF-like protein